MTYPLVFQDFTCSVIRESKHLWLRLLVFVLTALFAGIMPLCRADPPPVSAEPPSNRLTIEDVQGALKGIEGVADLETTVKDKLTDLYRQALSELQNAGVWSSKVAESDAARQRVPRELEELRAKLAASAPDTSEQIPENSSLSDLEQHLNRVQLEQSAAKKELALWEAEPQRRADWRRVELPKLVEAATKRLGEINAQLDVLAAESAAAEGTTEARRKLLLAARQRIEQELAAHEAERLRFETGGDWVSAQRDLAARRVAQADKLVKKWQEVVSERRRLDAEEQARDARWAALGVHPRLLPLAEANTELTRQQRGPSGLPAKIEQATREAVELEQEWTRVKTQFARVKDKIKAANQSGAVGLLLQRQHAELPDLRQHKERMRTRRDEISEVQLQLIEWEDQRSELGDVPATVARVLAGFGSEISAADREAVSPRVHELLEAKRTILDTLIADSNAYFYKLLDLDESQQRLVAETEAYGVYLRERVLWLPNTATLSRIDLTKARQGLQWLADRGQWENLVGQLADDAVRSPGSYLLAALLGILLVSARRLLRRRIEQLGREASAGEATSLYPTLGTLLHSTLLAAPWPTVTWFLAWRLAGLAEPTKFSLAVAAGLQTSTALLAITELFRQICRHGGLGEIHFGWPQSSLKVLRRELRRILIVGLPVVFVVAHNEGLGKLSSNDLYQAAPGRLAFILGMLWLALRAWYILHPARGILAEPARLTTNSWLERSRWLWALAAVGTPLAMACVAAWGYYYTALQLCWRLQNSTWLLVGLVVVYALLRRWLIVARRGLVADSQINLKQVDFVSLNRQTGRLLRNAVACASLVGLWLIWVDVLPALRVLDQFRLWSYHVDLASLPTAADDTMKAAVTGKLTWITAGDLLLAAVIVIMTFAASRNLPGFLEMAFWQRLPIDPGGRYALTSISRYAITVVGLLIACRTIGIGWSNVQWLVAAMTVGLGFGLQEIFANFVSGLIILFERPMRLGDTVTVGAVTGTVSQIRFRATTITDWDRKELIVPNREFITGQLVNWSLSDRILRTVLKVGVAYGSDTALVRKTLLDVAAGNPHVLTEPEPVAILDHFGESTLDFELRVYVDGLEHLVPVRHALNSAIEASFRQAGIEIAFPQCDLHVRSMEPLVVVDPRRGDRLHSTERSTRLAS